ncbi:MAG TPA: prepilin-type N-terminal cleavage/methylation domain-containing protein [Gemmatimonadales bacterium]|nr:prepilin-type N-terminal cleavage/methylation domain-containing protein [Gemmatimonadales bacterium]
MRTSNSGGFTLVEVLIAMVIGSLVVLLAHQLFATASDGTRRLEAARMRLERERLAARWLESAFLSLEAGGKDGSFEGHPHTVSFTTWLTQPGGWLEPRAVLIRVIDSSLRADTDHGPIGLQQGVREVDFDYLLEPGAESHWVREWVSPVSAPLAVRIRLTRNTGVDTTVMLIKGRG